jgi:dCTP deaminase
MILNDRQIRQRAEVGMITPFNHELVRLADGIKRISYGPSSFGYDVQLADECRVFCNNTGEIIDPKELDENFLYIPEIHTGVKGRWVILPPNTYMLGRTVEYFKIPRDTLVICLGKSTYARAGLQVNVTPLEPEFEGNIVIELANSTNSPMRVYVGEGIAQFLFLQGEECETSYDDRGGKYQGQTGITLPRV